MLPFALGLYLTYSIGFAFGIIVSELTREGPQRHGGGRSRPRGSDFEEYPRKNILGRNRDINLKERNGRQLCMVCEEQYISAKFYPCRDSLMCLECAQEYLNIGANSKLKPKCPKCAKVIQRLD